MVNIKQKRKYRTTCPSCGEGQMYTLKYTEDNQQIKTDIEWCKSCGKFFRRKYEEIKLGGK